MRQSDCELRAARHFSVLVQLVGDNFSTACQLPAFDGEARIYRPSKREADFVGVEGKGLPAEKLDGIHAQHSGVGIAGMRERVRHLRGAMDIHSNGTGTKISITMPITITAILDPENILDAQNSGIAV